MTIRHTEHDGTFFQDYDTIDDVLEHLGRSCRRVSQASRCQSSEEWDLGFDYDATIAAYTGGWADGARKAEELAEKVIPHPIGNRTTLARSVAGMFPNVGAHIAGAPNAMYRVSKKTARSRPYVHMHLPIGYLGGVDADTAFNRGCAMVAVVDALEIAGCRVRVTLMRVTRLSTGRFNARFEVKGYGDKLDIDQLIFTAAHPAFYRRLIFALQERSEFGEVRTGGYGSTDDPRAFDMEPDGNAVLVLFPTLTPRENGTSPEKFLEKMVRALPPELQTEIEGE